MHRRKGVALAAIAISGAMALAACGSSSSGGNPGPSTGGSTGASTGTGSVPDISTSDFNPSYSSFSELKSVAAAGKGGIGVLLPDTTTSARYAQFDAPDLTKAFETAGLQNKTDFTVENAEGNNQTQISQAQADLSNGDSVLIVDPLTTEVGARIESLGTKAGAQVIDYDRLTLGGSRSYYISFNNVQVGKLIGNGFATCAAAWGVTSPKIIEMVGDPTDNNATLFSEGYNKVIAAHSNWDVVAKPVGTWDPPTALTEFTQAFTANPDANSAIIPNDENAGPIIGYLQQHGIKAKTFPITGQDATSVGIQNILTGYQCGTAYKPYYLEAQAAAAVALYVRAGDKPPADLVNGTTEDTQENKAVPSVLLTPEWVTTNNIESTVVKDGQLTAKEICIKPVTAAECKAAGIH